MTPLSNLDNLIEKDTRSFNILSEENHFEIMKSLEKTRKEMDMDAVEAYDFASSLVLNA